MGEGTLQWLSGAYEGISEDGIQYVTHPLLVYIWLIAYAAPQDIEDARLPDALAGAKYTISSRSDVDSDSESPSDPDSGSDSDSSDSDSNADSDDSDSPKARERAKKQKKADKKAEKKKAVKKLQEAAKKKADAEAKKEGLKKKKKSADKDGKSTPKKTAKKSATTAAHAGEDDEYTAGEPSAKSAKKRRWDPSPVSALRKSRRLNVDGGPMNVDSDPAAALPSSMQLAPFPSTLAPPTSTQPAPASPSHTQAPPEPDTPLTPPATVLFPEVPATIPVVFPENAPNWLKAGIAWLTKQDLGCHYRALMVALIQLEAKYGFDPANNGSLGTANRPTQISLWIRGGRGSRMKFPPTINRINKYATQWALWWDGLQPAWRERGDDGHWRIDSGWGPHDQWDPLEAPGQNGCLSVVASLYFWGLYNAKQPAHLQETWERAVLDVTWMLEGLCASVT
jgi:hypothetical protein